MLEGTCGENAGESFYLPLKYGEEINTVLLMMIGTQGQYVLRT